MSQRSAGLCTRFNAFPVLRTNLSSFSKNVVVTPVHTYRPVAPGCAGCAMAHPDFGRSVNPISIRGDRLCPPNYYWHTQIFRPSDGPGHAGKKTSNLQIIFKCETLTSKTFLGGKTKFLNLTTSCRICKIIYPFLKKSDRLHQRLNYYMIYRTMYYYYYTLFFTAHVRTVLKWTRF